MVWPFTASQHQQNIAFKREERQQRIKALPEYREPLTSAEKKLLGEYVEDVVGQITAGDVKPETVLKAYGKAALQSQEKTNCLTEIMIRDAEGWAHNANLKGPLAGFPVSLKDPFFVAGYDATAGYSSLLGKKPTKDGSTVQLLRDAGAVPYVKTNIPITMMAIEGWNDVYGRTVNPHKATHAPGGSSQGEGALIASGGSRIGLGSDIGGSVRVPAAWSGIYSLRFSSHRFPADGDLHNDHGYDGVPAVVSPMARTLKDLKYFADAVMGMKPWNYDHKLVKQPWNLDAKLPDKPKIGVLQFKDYMPVTPAISRALQTTADALKKQGYEVVDIELPSPAIEYDENVFRLYNGMDPEVYHHKLLPGELSDPVIQDRFSYLRWPRPLRKLWEFVLNLFGFKEKAWRLRVHDRLTSNEFVEESGRRQRLRRGMFEKWNAEKLDFVITPAHQSPALPNGQPDSFWAILYTSLWNLLDYPAGIIPVGRVDKVKDALPKDFTLKDKTFPTRITFAAYDAEAMEGLPTAVQVVTPRYRDEEALVAMQIVEDALHKAGVYYE